MDLTGNSTRQTRGTDSVSSIARIAVAIAILLPALLGCAPFRGYPERVTSSAEDLAALAPAINAKQILACLAVSEKARECRNQLVTARVHAINLQFTAFEEDLFRQTREVGFAATIVTLGLNAAGALSSGGTGQALAAMAGVITGSRAAFEREVLAERTVMAIHTAMRANRTAVLARIRQGLKQDVSEYALGTALDDVEEYYFAGTILGALVGISKAVGVQAAEADRSLAIATGLSQSEAARALRRYFNEPGISDEEKLRRLRAIQAAARDEGLGDIAVGSFIRDDTRETEEQQSRLARRLRLLP